MSAKSDYRKAYRLHRLLWIANCYRWWFFVSVYGDKIAALPPAARRAAWRSIYADRGLPDRRKV